MSNRTVIFRCVLAFAFLASLFSVSAETVPTADRWMAHFREDLLPFWSMPEALGNPAGNFPSVRNNDGTLVDRKNPSPEIKGNYWLLTDQEYTVSRSRQTYAYGVAYHLTGDTRYLDWAKAGAEHLLKNAWDRTNGGTYALWNGSARRWEPEPKFRNPQELAYSLLGVGFYYYLTRDPKLLPDILAVKDVIFRDYFNEKIGAMQWLLESTKTDAALSKRLTAQLDNLNAYMVLLAPILPEPHKSAWIKDMVKLSKVMMDQFYSEKDNLFFLDVTDPAARSTATADTDFGHTIKSLWMIRAVGQIAGRYDLVEFAEARGAKVLERARLQDGSWASGVKKGGAMDAEKSWWIYAELDQFAWTMAMTDPAYARFLPQATYFLANFVDKKQGELWTALDAKGKPKANYPSDLPKIWPWKNAYHSFEHAMVGWISARAQSKEPVVLHFAFQKTPDTSQVKPYFFRADKVTLRSTDKEGRSLQRAEFLGVK